MATPITAVRPVFRQGVHYVTSGFGMRTYSFSGRMITEHHDGIDLVAKYVAADYVTAFADGTVRETLNNVLSSAPSQGNYVKIDHGNDIFTVYYHLKAGSVKVKRGERVKAGQVIGYMGSSGNSTGPHLHFGIMIGGKWQDPLPYLEGKRSLLEKKTYKEGALCGVNTPRGTDELVLYLKKSSTGTNKWGVEVPIDLRGVVLSDPVYGVGNMDIPSEGKVLSGNGLAGKWILDNIKKGQLVWFSNNKVCIARGVHHSVGVNCVRGQDMLVLYNKGRAANTNPYGFEVAVNSRGVAESDPIYGKGKMKIPEGGYVLSGHGEAGKWLYSNVKKGTLIAYDPKSLFIKIK